jgi:hypothetical protein
MQRNRERHPYRLLRPPQVEHRRTSLRPENLAVIQRTKAPNYRCLSAVIAAGGEARTLDPRAANFNAAPPAGHVAGALLLAAAGRQPPAPAAVRGDGAQDGGAARASVSMA